MDYEHAVRVNFGRPMPVFPLSSAVVVPQQVVPLHIFEDRYIRMVRDVLDGAGQIAMAVFAGDDWKSGYTGRPAIRPAVCVGQIMQHETLPGGRFDILLQGVCRARVKIEMPDDGKYPYRLAHLEPTEGPEPDDAELQPMRDWVASELRTGDLAEFESADDLLEYVADERINTATLLELISFTLLTDAELRYRLLDEGDAIERSKIVKRALELTSKMLRLARHQHPEDWPKGMSWN
ncbi:MAG: LON peptidase substrate-binding domain-containing protein [Phycisphaerales bacterium]|nr:LON peptidase substrate-binding domain-containing protein [Phycisphaerales bacterium]MCB9837491.1 LON peptidase substrate-binding domain-containing protein [Phycisphaera sp.]